MKNLDESKYKAYGYDGRVLRTSLCPTGRMNKVVDNEKTLPTTIVHTHRLLAHIPTRLNNNYFLTVIKPLKSNTYSEATTQYFFCPSATPFIEASGYINIMWFLFFTTKNAHPSLGRVLAILYDF